MLTSHTITIASVRVLHDILLYYQFVTAAWEFHQTLRFYFETVTLLLKPSPRRLLPDLRLRRCRPSVVERHQMRRQRYSAINGTLASSCWPLIVALHRQPQY